MSPTDETTPAWPGDVGTLLRPYPYYPLLDFFPPCYLLAYPPSSTATRYDLIRPQAVAERLHRSGSGNPYFEPWLHQDAKCDEHGRFRLRDVDLDKVELKGLFVRVVWCVAVDEDPIARAVYERRESAQTAYSATREDTPESEKTAARMGLDGAVAAAWEARLSWLRRQGPNGMFEYLKDGGF